MDLTMLLTTDRSVYTKASADVTCKQACCCQLLQPIFSLSFLLCALCLIHPQLVAYSHCTALHAQLSKQGYSTTFVTVAA